MEGTYSWKPVAPFGPHEKIWPLLTSLSQLPLIRDLGRFWNITRTGTSKYSQEYYLLPDDFFYTDGSLNEIILFDAVGGAAASAELVLSWIEPTPEPNFQDEIDYPLECI